jgi:type II secretory pathway component PulF
MVSQMFSTGEKTGDLTSSMNQVGDYCDRQLTLLTKRVLTLLEPAMIVMLAGMVGFLIVTLLTTIYSLMGQLGK